MTTEAIDRTTQTIITPIPPTTAYVPIQRCRCGHELEAHRHHRPGNDCGACGSTQCKSYRRRAGRGVRLWSGRL